MKRKVVIGFVGTQLDAGKSVSRWEKWRPTVSLTQHEELLVHRMVLLHDYKYQSLAVQLKEDISSVSPETEITLTEINIGNPWDFGEVYAALFDFAQRYPFDTENEEYWIHITTGTHVVQICLFLLVETGYFPGLLLQTSPPRNQQSGLPGNYALIDLDLSQYDAITQRFAREQSDAINLLKSGIATRNEAFNRIIGEIEHVAMRSKAPMLMMGPTGAGKSFLANRVYQLKKARHQITGSFVEVNCATLRGDGAASALFGHVKGAFTGAQQDRGGLLLSAHQGLLFLDEIGELGLDEQAMLLKAIEEKTFYPVGSDKLVTSDFQLIAGTHRDLQKDVMAGRFREDLYARINLWTYELPPLSQRPEDIEPNIDYFLTQQSIELGRKISFNKQARAKYLRFATSTEAKWQGNFRDLGASILRLATLADGGRIADDLVDQETQRLLKLWGHQEITQSTLLTDILPQGQLEESDLFDRMQLQSVIEVCRECTNLSEAGRRLFSVSRTQRGSTNDADRLRKYLSRFNLDWSSIKRNP